MDNLKIPCDAIINGSIDESVNSGMWFDHVKK